MLKMRDLCVIMALSVCCLVAGCGDHSSEASKLAQQNKEMDGGMAPASVLNQLKKSQTNSGEKMQAGFQAGAAAAQAKKAKPQ